jgi:hypothetical protein
MVLEEVTKKIVEYEPCILDFNDQCIVFDVNGELALMHPEIWLLLESIEEIRSIDQGKGMRKNQSVIIETPKKWQ